jgi:hypothetical protein
MSHEFNVRAAFTILEFCRRNGISKSHYYNQPEHLRPRTFRFGDKPLISREEEVEWHRRLQELAETERKKAAQ